MISSWDLYEVFTITTNEHLSHTLRLAMCATISIVGLWYPLYIAGQFAEYDNRMGFFIFFVAGPFLLLAASFSIILLLSLSVSLSQFEQSGVTSWALLG
jgi:hypothetical protein